MLVSGIMGMIVRHDYDSIRQGLGCRQVF